jgi:hypothetical protein
MASEARPVADVLYGAVRYALDRVQADPEFRYHMLLTETFDRLMAAESAYLGRSIVEVRQARQSVPEHIQLIEARCSEDRERVRMLERLLLENGIEIPRR